MSETRGLWAQATENEDQALNISLSGRHNDWRDLEVSAQAPTWEVLRIALRNQGIPNRDWKDYVVLIRHGPPENRIEHCLSWDGRPLAKFMKLKNAGKDPAFILKRLESLPSPIVIAQKKIAARTNAGHDDTESVLDIRSLGLGEGTMGQLVDSTTSEEALAHGRPRHGHGFCNSTAADIRSYAVAVYPYIAAQGDEFDVAVGDTFSVLSRASGWLVVQRDQRGGGIVDSESSMERWIPKGCVLETSIPMAPEPTTSRPDVSPISGGNGSPQIAVPILAQSIISKSAPGIALMDYRRKGDWELDMASGDALRVFKRHVHWSYVVKTDSGDRGWVPSWFVGGFPLQAMAL